MSERERIEEGRGKIERVREEIGRVVVGNREVVDGVLTCLLAGGHALLEGLPGLGKTLLVKTLARTLGLRFSRIQFTPDLMPADVIGTNLILEDPGGGRRFVFQPGPVFAHVLLADEINRATPKTQSALLEAMQEGHVTAGGETRRIEEPFCVLATENPIEMEGTFPLPEAQLDRFFFKIRVQFPGLEELGAIVDRTAPIEQPDPECVLGRDDLLGLRRLVREVPVPEAVKEYALRLVLATHPEAGDAPAPAKKYVRYGSSPRGAQAILLGARVRAFLDGRPNASFVDVRETALPALRHRILLNFEGQAEGVDPDTILAGLLAEVAELTGVAGQEAARLEKEGKP